jgi:hypothetical protein
LGVFSGRYDLAIKMPKKIDNLGTFGSGKIPFGDRKTA